MSNISTDQVRTFSAVKIWRGSTGATKVELPWSPTNDSDVETAFGARVWRSGQRTWECDTDIEQFSAGVRELRKHYAGGHYVAADGAEVEARFAKTLRRVSRTELSDGTIRTEYKGA